VCFSSLVLAILSGVVYVVGFMYSFCIIFFRLDWLVVDDQLSVDKTSRVDFRTL